MMKYVMGFWVIVLLAMGCHDPYSKGWSWGITAENGDRDGTSFKWDSHEVRVENILLSGEIPVDAHKTCRKRHYHDPYTKKEYCLPEDFSNINHLHLHRVK